MIIDYKNTIKRYVEKVGNRFECKGIIVGETFMPSDMIKQLYDKAFNYKGSLDYNHCKEIPNEKEYEYYQWNGDPEDIRRVNFLNSLSENFSVGCRDYVNYHLDYKGEDGIVDIYPGDYIINRENSIEICRKEEFENKFIFR